MCILPPSLPRKSSKMSERASEWARGRMSERRSEGAKRRESTPFALLAVIITFGGNLRLARQPRDPPLTPLPLTPPRSNSWPGEGGGRRGRNLGLPDTQIKIAHADWSAGELRAFIGWSHYGIFQGCQPQRGCVGCFLKFLYVSGVYWCWFLFFI